MKKLMGFCFFILLSVFSILSIINYSYDAVESIERDKEAITVQKPDSITNGDFLNSIDFALEDIDKDIMYRYVDVTGTKVSYNYYKTNHTANFLNVKSSKTDWKINADEVISTIDQKEYKNYELQVSPLFQNISFFNWSNAEKYDLSNCIFYVNRSDVDAIANQIMQLGYPVTINKTTYVSGKLSVLLFTFVPAFLMVLSVIFYVLSNGKKSMLKKMEGYNTLSIIIEEIKENILMFIGIFVLVEGITIISAILLMKTAFFTYISYSARYLMGVLGVLIFSIFAAYILTALQVGVEYIKGMVPKSGIYYVSMLAKCIFIVFISFFMSIAIRNVLICYNTVTTSNFLAEKVKNYVTIPIYENNASSEGLEEAYRELYDETVDKYDGILIDSSNYEYSLTDAENLSEKYSQDYIVINANYLTFNPIYQSNHEAITRELLRDDKLNIILPTSKEDERTEYAENANLWFNQEANFILYDDSITNIYSYNARSGNSNYGEIESPVIIVGNETVLEGGLLKSYFSKGSYFIKTYSDDPYSELLPLLQKVGLEAVTPETPYISTNFDDILQQQIQMLILYGSETVVLTIGLLFLIIFACKIYCENYRDRIACCLIEGYTVLNCIRKHLIIIVINYALCFIAAFVLGNIMQVSINYYLLAITFGIELLITILLCKSFTKQNLYAIQKGAD